MTTVEIERDTIHIWLPEVPVKKLLNVNDAKYHNYHARHAGQIFWETMMRGALDTTFLIERAYVVVRYFKCSLHQADVGNYYPTAKAIVDGLVRKKHPKTGQLQDGFFQDDNDRRIVGPDQRRGLDSSLRIGRQQLVRVRVEIQPIGPMVERWWEPEMSLPLDFPGL